VGNITNESEMNNMWFKIMKTKQKGQKQFEIFKDFSVGLR
jgi:hypothetical protein